MYCRYCGNQLKEGAKFCTKCGKGIQKDSEVKFEKKQIFGKKCGVPGIAILVVLIGVLVWKAMHNYAIGEADLCMLIEKEEISKIDVDGSEMLLVPKKISIISEKKDRVTNVYNIICKSTAANEWVEADIQYQLAVSGEGDKWKIESNDAMEVLDVRPIKGVADDYAERLKEGIRNAYAQHIGDYESIVYNIVEHNTHLKEKTDSLTYTYTISTYTAQIEGEIKLDYLFTENGEWKLNGSELINNTVEWNLEGLWNPKYFYVYIENMNYTNNIASVYVAEASPRAEFSTEMEGIQYFEIPFQIEDRQIKFDIFSFEIDDQNDGIEIEITAEIGDMHYSIRIPKAYSYIGSSIIGYMNGKKEYAEENTETRNSQEENIRENSIGENHVIAQGENVTGIIEEEFMPADANVGGMDTSYYVLVFDEPVKLEVYDADRGGVYIGDNYGDGYSEIPIFTQNNEDLSMYIGRKVRGNLTASESYTRMGVTALFTDITVE